MQTILPSANLSTTHFWFHIRVQTPLQMDEFSGTALRGSLFNAIWRRFCTNQTELSCARCPLHDLCPVSALVTPLREDHERGQDIPRPYVLTPPLEGIRCYQPGEHFSFGLTLIGKIIHLFPYILLSLSQMEQDGLGRPLAENDGRRGRFQIETVDVFHPLTAERQVLYQEGTTHVHAPSITTDVEEWRHYATRLDQTTITLRLLTPLRLVDHDRLVKHLTFLPLIHRLLERYSALERYYGNDQYHMTREEKETLLQCAETITCSSDHTRWIEQTSHSHRQQRSTPTGGLVGEITFKGNLTPFLALLIAGESLHLGKNAVKGNGKYEIIKRKL